MQRQDRQTPSDVEAYAFAHLDNLASLLYGSGRHDMAALLYGMGDMHRLAQRRAAKGRGEELLGPSDATVAYALDQLNELARLLEAQGLGDAALLLRTPAKLQAAADRRRGAEGAEIYVLPTARAPAEARGLAGSLAFALARSAG